MFSGNTLVFHHCLCRKISLQFAVPNAAIPGTKGDTNLSYDCTRVPVIHSTVCSIKLSSHHLKPSVLIIFLYCACRKSNANGLVINTNRKKNFFAIRRKSILLLLLLNISYTVIYLQQTIFLCYIMLQLWLKFAVF